MDTSELTQLLDDWTAGDKDAIDRIMPLVYNDLRRMAENRFSKERANHTLQPTALVNEVYLKLTQQNLTSLEWESREHFLRMVSITMQRILIDSARKHRAQKKGNDKRAPEPTDGMANLSNPSQLSADTVIALSLALDKLEKMDSRQTGIVRLRFFVGLTNGEIAELLQIGERTVRREWETAKAWLSRELDRSTLS